MLAADVLLSGNKSPRFLVSKGGVTYFMVTASKS